MRYDMSCLAPDLFNRGRCGGLQLASQFESQLYPQLNEERSRYGQKPLSGWCQLSMRVQRNPLF